MLCREHQAELLQEDGHEDRDLPARWDPRTAQALNRLRETTGRSASFLVTQAVVQATSDEHFATPIRPLWALHRAYGCTERASVSGRVAAGLVAPAITARRSWIRLPAAAPTHCSCARPSGPPAAHDTARSILVAGGRPQL